MLAGCCSHEPHCLCRFTGWFLPMFFAGRLETKNVADDTAAGWARELGPDHFLPELAEMAEVEVLHEKYFLKIIGRQAPERRSQSMRG